MKKLVVCMLLGVLFLGTTACGSRDGQADASSESVVQESSSEETQTETDVEESSEESLESEPAETGVWSEEMSGLREAVAEELGSDYWPTEAMPAEYLEASFGLTSDMYEDYMGEMPLMSVHVDTLLIVKAAEGKEEAVEAALQAYRDAQIANQMQYPMNLGKVQAARVERMGSYVCFVLLGGDVTAAEEQGEESIVAQCQEHNQRALDAIAQILVIE